MAAVGSENGLEQSLGVSFRAPTHELGGPLYARVHTPQRPRRAPGGPRRRPTQDNFIQGPTPFWPRAPYRCRDKDETTWSCGPRVLVRSIILATPLALSLV